MNKQELATLATVTAERMKLVMEYHRIRNSTVEIVRQYGTLISTNRDRRRTSHSILNYEEVWRFGKYEYTMDFIKHGDDDDDEPSCIHIGMEKIAP